MSMNEIERALKEHLGCQEIRSPSVSSGSMLNDCIIYDTDKGRFFVKTHRNIDSKMFAAEKMGLQQLEDTKTVRVPHPFFAGGDNHFNFIIIEYLELSSHNKDSQSKLGTQLAKLHLTKGPERFGFEIDNTIGTTPQINTWTDEWVAFFSECRLRFQCRLIDKKYKDRELLALTESLLHNIPDFFKGLTLFPSLIHGDLWGGNTSADQQGNPVIYDPAPYYAHHEAELSIAAMFGGFSPEFYEAYHALIPRETGFEERQKLYQLYHYMNHYVIFGSGYRSRCLSIVKAL